MDTDNVLLVIAVAINGYAEVKDTSARDKLAERIKEDNPELDENTDNSFYYKILSIMEFCEGFCSDKMQN